MTYQTVCLGCAMSFITQSKLKFNQTPIIMRERLLKLTCATSNETILIGVESIISVKTADLYEGTRVIGKCTKIESRAAMVSINRVVETPEEIYKLYKANKS
jgi:hypothetical protein